MKKHRSFFEVYDKIAFHSEPGLSQKIDEILYGKKPETKLSDKNK